MITPDQDRSTAKRSFPDDVYVTMVASLFDDARSLLVGSIAAFASAVVTAWKTDDPLLAVCAAAIIVVSARRRMTMRAFQWARQGLRSADDVRVWERRYENEATLYVILLGAWCMATFLVSQDPLVRLLSFSLVLAYLIGISGRNFASDRLVIAQTLSAGIFMMFSLIVAGPQYGLVFVFVLLPLLISVRAISARLRKLLLDAVHFGHDNMVLASRFDTALSNLPMGLAMFDRQGRLVVGNARLNALLGFRRSQVSYGVPIGSLVQWVADGGLMLKADVAYITGVLQTRMARPIDNNLTVALTSGTILDLKFHAMDNGGSLMLIEDVTERRNAEDKINRLAHFDPLTGLSNRLAFKAQIAKRLTQVPDEHSSALLFVDLDNFKQVNDTLGHAVGDKLLQLVAQRLTGAVRATDLVARFGGDEFLIFQAPVADEAEPIALAERLIEVLAEEFAIDTHQIAVSASVGIALARSSQFDVDMVIKHTDLALYAAKAAGRSTFRVFHSQMEVMANARRSIALEMRRALENGDFELHYQPIIDLHSQAVISVEALLRWRHPQRGMIPPIEFIPIAEENGFIVELGAFVLSRACADCATWPKHLSVAVNLSTVQFERCDLPAMIRATLEKTGLSPNRLEVEITESLLMRDTDASRMFLDQIREMGVGVSLDDFGTGYSSLSYLQSFPLTKVKIDKSFLERLETSPRARRLLGSAARLLRDLDLTVVVEGVETQEQLEILQFDIHTGQAQGYLMGRPMPFQQITAHMVDNHAARHAA